VNQRACGSCTGGPRVRGSAKRAVADVIVSAPRRRSQLHLRPRTVLGRHDQPRLALQHAGASSGGSGAAAVVQARTPSAEQRALQRIAIAQPACELESTGHLRRRRLRPPAAGERPCPLRLVHDHGQAGPRPGRSARRSKPRPPWPNGSPGRPRSLWSSTTTLWHPQCGTLQNECDQAHASATAAVAAHAQQRLANCTGTSLISQLRDIAPDLRLRRRRPRSTSRRSGLPLRNQRCAPRCLRAPVRSRRRLPGRRRPQHREHTSWPEVTVNVFSGPDRTDVPSRSPWTAPV